MACSDCLNNCPEEIKDRCIEYTGEDNDSLDICNGQSLYTVLKTLISSVESLYDGSGITLSDLSGCTIINPEDNSLYSVIQGLYTAVCSIKQSVDSISTQVNESVSFNTDCLEDLPSSPTRDDILQATLNKSCDNDSRISAIEEDYVKNSDLCSLVTSCVQEQQSTQYYTRMVPYVAVPYHGPLSNFDAQGKGLSANGYDKIYLCVGQTVGSFVVPDYRGRSPIGANTNVPGSTLDISVDPSQPGNSAYSITQGTKKGAYTHQLVNSEAPAHSHTVNDSGHTHTYNTFTTNNGGNLPNGFASSHSSSYNVQTTSSSTTGITINSSGGSQAHNNTHPVVGCVFIIHVP